MTDKIIEELIERIRSALAMVPNIKFYRYQISFKLMKAYTKLLMG